jgi:hypothetical protein
VPVLGLKVCIGLVAGEENHAQSGPFSPLSIFLQNIFSFGTAVAKSILEGGSSAGRLKLKNNSSPGNDEHDSDFNVVKGTGRFPEV